METLVSTFLLSPFYGLLGAARGLAALGVDVALLTSAAPLSLRFSSISAAKAITASCLGIVLSLYTHNM